MSPFFKRLRKISAVTHVMQCIHVNLTQVAWFFTSVSGWYGMEPFFKGLSKISAVSQQWLMSCSVSMSTWLRLHDFWLLVVRCPRLIWDGALLASGTKDMRSARTPPLIHKVQLSVEKKGVVGWVPPLGGLFFVRVGFQSWRLYSVLWYLRFVCIT